MTTINTASDAYVNAQAARDGTHPTRHAEAEKIKKHREASAAAGYGYYTAGWTVYGAHFGDFYEKLVRPHFKAAKKRAIANGEDPWRVQAQHDRLRDRWSVVIARWNARAMRCARVRDARGG